MNVPDELTKAVIEDLRRYALRISYKIQKFLEEQRWDDALNAISVLEYLVSSARDWKQP